MFICRVLQMLFTCFINFFANLLSLPIPDYRLDVGGTILLLTYTQLLIYLPNCKHTIASSGSQ